MTTLGNASYAMYLIHVPLFTVFEHFQWQTRPTLYPVYLALCIGTSVLSFKYFETPVRIWLLKWFEAGSLRESVAKAERLGV